MVSAPSLLIFDMDGVLVDVRESYRLAIAETVQHFTGAPVSNDTIQQFKMQVGWNDDWRLSHRLIQDAGVHVLLEDVVAYFQSVFRGDTGYSGLIQNETWIAQDGLFERLGRRHRLAIFTGRFREEAEVTLRRFAPHTFDPVVATDELQNGKPHPEGLLKICAAVPHERVFYLGDTADDARSAEAAGVPFIAIVGPGTPCLDESITAFREGGAVDVLASINELEPALARLVLAEL